MSDYHPNLDPSPEPVGLSMDANGNRAQSSLVPTACYPDKMKPELIINSKPIDFELCELLGDKPADFLVLCLDGVQLEGFGTPYDTPRNRTEKDGLIERLNDRSEKSLWPDLWRNWKSNICKQFGLPETTTENDYRPVVSYKISRVCHGHSEHLYSAIGLFGKFADKIEAWGVAVNGPRKFVTIKTKSGEIFEAEEKAVEMPLLIVQTVIKFLKANQDNRHKLTHSREKPI